MTQEKQWTGYAPRRVRSLWLSRDLMRKIEDRLGLLEQPLTSLKDPIELRPILSLTLDIDAMVKEPNYVINDTSATYTAGAGFKPVWSVPDDEIAEDIEIIIDSQNAIRTMTVLAHAEDDATAPTGLYPMLVQQAASQIVGYRRSDSAWKPLTLYPGETFWAYFDVNAAGGTFNVSVRYIRLKTTEVPL